VTVLELVAALAAGGVAGWMGHALYRWAHPERRAPAVAGPTPVGVPPPASTPLDPSPGRPRPGSISEGANIAGRVILHLYAQGRLAPHEVADPEFTQEGIGLALSLRQGTVARVVGRLAAAGVLESDRRHVRGRPRRLTVYTVTPLGESVARDLRKQAAPSSSAPRAVGGTSESRAPPPRGT
jgi:DNA-binding MarR family transcriptional regulator